VTNQTEPMVDRTDCTPSDKHVLFRSGQSWFSVPAVAVREITIAPDLASVPGCHRTLEGLCRQQSEFIPVISLDALLEVETTGKTQENNQLLTFAANTVWAIRIAEAAALESVETITSPEDRHDTTASSPVIGTAIFGDRVVRVLNPDRLYQLTAQALEQQWTGQQSLSPSAPGDQR